MLLTLHAASVKDMLAPPGEKATGGRIALGDLPAYCLETLGLHGLNLSTAMLKGSTPAQLEALRDRGDKAGCSILLLIESGELPIGDGSDETEAAIERAGRVIRAGNLLGCSAVAVPFTCPDDEEASEYAVEALQRVMKLADRRDMNVLIQPAKGLTESPDKLTDLIKRVGGFRIGAYPDFQTAAQTDDPEGYMKRLTPYAAAVSASVEAFEVQAPEPAPKKESSPDPAEELDPGDPLARLEADLEALLGPEEEDEPEAQVTHSAYDLDPLLRAVTAVGFDSNLVIEYRGESDGTMGVLHARAAIEQSVDRLSAEA
ncbi:MAG: TIM barrel protein [Planctomycetota bacterium]